MIDEITYYYLFAKDYWKYFYGAGVELRLQDQLARQELVEMSISNVTFRPVVSLHVLQENLAGLNRFKIGKPSEADNQQQFSRHFLDIGDNNKITTTIPDVQEVINNIRHYRVMSVDTEGKEHPLFLIIGDFCGNVLMFNNSLNCPQELIEFIEDVRIFKVQSNIKEDWQMLRKVNITMKGTADSQVIFGAFVQPLGKKGTAAQSIAVGADSRPFDKNVMFFNTKKTRYGRTNQRPTNKEWLHAVMDARQPFLTLFKATVLRVQSFALTPTPVKPDDDVFGYLWDCLNRVAGVPIKDFVEGKPPYKLLPSDNWLTGKTFHSNQDDLNSRLEVLAIQTSQKDWPAAKKHRTSAFRNQFRSEQERMAWNWKRYQAFKIRVWLKKKRLLSTARPYHYYLKH